MAFTVIPSTAVDVDSPVSVTLMGWFVGNDNYLKSAITDGASAAQGISTSTVTTSGPATFGGNLAINGGTITTSASSLTWAVSTTFNGNVTVNGSLSFAGIDLTFLNNQIALEGF